MTTRLLVTLAAAVLWCGCSSVGTVNTDRDASGLQEVNRAVRGKVVHLKLHGGETMNVVGVRVAPDSLTWVNHKANRIESLATSSIDELSIRKAGSGAVRGLVVGALAGAAAGGVRAGLQGDDPANDPLSLTKEEKYRVYPVAHAVYASLLSTPIGAMIGTKKVYRFEHGGSDFPTVVSER